MSDFLVQDYGINHKRALTTGKSRKKYHGKKKIKIVMREFKHGTLHSGKSRTGPIVTSRRQAVAIAMSEDGLSSKRK